MNKKKQNQKIVRRMARRTVSCLLAVVMVIGGLPLVQKSYGMELGSMVFNPCDGELELSFILANTQEVNVEIYVDGSHAGYLIYREELEGYEGPLVPMPILCQLGSSPLDILDSGEEESEDGAGLDGEDDVDGAAQDGENGQEQDDKGGQELGNEGDGQQGVIPGEEDGDGQEPLRPGGGDGQSRQPGEDGSQEKQGQGGSEGRPNENDGGQSQSNENDGKIGAGNRPFSAIQLTGASVGSGAPLAELAEETEDTEVTDDKPDSDEDGQPGDRESENEPSDGEGQPTTAEEDQQELPSDSVEATENPMIQNAKIKIRNLEEPEQEEILPFAFFLDADEPEGPGPGDAGYHEFVWDGRLKIDKMGNEIPIEGGIPVLGDDETRDYCVVQLVVQPMGYPDRHRPPTCGPDEFDEIQHDCPGEDWIWSQQYRQEGPLFLIDYRAGVFLVLQGGLYNGDLDLLLHKFLTGEWDIEYLLANEFGDIELEVGLLEPVNMVTGSFYTSYVDLEIFGSFPLQFTRLYNSLDKTEGDFGVGFSHSYEYVLTDDRGIITVEVPYGEVMKFIRQLDDSNNVYYHSLQAQDFTLEDRGAVGNGSYRLSHTSGIVFDLESVGAVSRPVSVTSPTKVEMVQLTYDGDRLSTIQSKAGSLSFSYSGGKISRITDSAGRQVRYGYENGVLSQFTNADGDSLVYGSDENGYVDAIWDFDGNLYLENVYDEDGRVIWQKMITGAGGEATATISYDEEFDPFAMVEEKIGLDYSPYDKMTVYTNRVKTFEGETKYYSYNRYMQLLDIEDAGVSGKLSNSVSTVHRVEEWEDRMDGFIRYELDEGGSVEVASYSDGAVVRATYNSDGKPTEIRYLDKRTGNEYTEKFTYDSKGNLTSQIDRRGNITTFSYSNGLRTSVTDPLGNETKYKYTTKGFLESVTDPLGYVTRYEYDDVGRVIKVIEPGEESPATTYMYTDAGKLQAVRNAMGKEKRFTYTPNGFLEAETDFTGRTTRKVTYGVSNLPVEEEDGEGNLILFEYDNKGYLSKQTVVASQGSRQDTVSYRYDNRGRLFEFVDQEGNKETYQYDDMDRISSVTNADGETESYKYDSLGRLTSITDKRGNEVEMEYDYNGKLIEMKAPLGAVTKLIYDPNGNMVKKIDPEGNTTSYTYDAADRITEIKDAEGRTTTYIYDRAGRIVEQKDGNGDVTKFEFDARGNALSIINPVNDKIKMTYDSMNRMITQVDHQGNPSHFEYDDNGNLIKMTNQEGEVAAYEYDSLGRVIKAYDALGYDQGHYTEISYYGTYGAKEITYPDGAKELYTYNKAGLIESTTNRNGDSSRCYYDNLLRLTKVIDEEGYQTVYRYDAVGNPISLTRDGKTVYTYTYDALNRPIEFMDANGYTGRMEYDLVGNLLAETDRNGNTTQYVYDKTGLLIQDIDPLGYSKGYIYDGISRLVEEQDQHGNSILYEYDKLGNLAKVTDGQYSQVLHYNIDSQLIGFTDRNGNTQNYKVDKLGRIKEIEKEYDADEIIVLYDHDKNGNVVHIVDVDKNDIYYSYDVMNNLLEEKNQMNNTIQYKYDYLGNITEVTDRNGHTTVYEYDGLSRLTDKLTPEGSHIRHEYDAFSNLTAISVKEKEGIFHTTNFEFDPYGNLLGEVSSMGERKSFVSDPEGNVIVQVDAEGNVLQYSYDANNRISSLIFDDETIIYEYDGKGNLITARGSEGTTTLEYDIQGQITKTEDSAGFVTHFSYDGNGNKRSISYKPVGYDGKTVEYHYDTLDRLVEMVEDGVTEKIYEYDRKGQLIKKIYKSGETTEYAYNKAGMLLELWENIGVSQRRNLKFGYDENGNLRSEVGTSIGIGLQDETKLYTYDRDNQMVTSILILDASPQSSTSYTYDLRGNLIQETRLEGNIAYKYNQRNQLIQVTDETGDALATTQYRYDKNGSLVEKTDADGSWSYTYDSRGQLTEGKNPDEEISRYSYNALGVRTGHQEIRSNANVGHQNVIYAPGSRSDKNPLDGILREDRFDHQRIWETVYSTVVQNDMETVKKNYFTDYTSMANRDIFIEEEGSYLQYYVYDGGLTPVNVTIQYAEGTKRGEQGENPGSDVAANNTVRGYFHQGLLGSNLYVTTEEGEILTHMRYDEWGTPLNETRYDMNYHGLDNINNFTGYSYDEVLNVYYAQARMYDSQIHRFISEDPVKEGVSWYGYVRNNPLVLIDPLGLFTEKSTLKYGDGISGILNQNYDKTALDIVDLQIRLIALGFLEPSSKIKYGSFDKHTLAAVNKFKNQYELGNEGAYEGVVGAQTWKMLGLYFENEVKTALHYDNQLGQPGRAWGHLFAIANSYKEVPKTLNTIDRVPYFVYNMGVEHYKKYQSATYSKDALEVGSWIIDIAAAIYFNSQEAMAQGYGADPLTFFGYTGLLTLESIWYKMEDVPSPGIDTSWLSSVLIDGKIERLEKEYLILLNSELSYVIDTTNKVLNNAYIKELASVTSNALQDVYDGYDNNSRIVATEFLLNLARMQVLSQYRKDTKSRLNIK